MRLSGYAGLEEVDAVKGWDWICAFFVSFARLGFRGAGAAA